MSQTVESFYAVNSLHLPYLKIYLVHCNVPILELPHESLNLQCQIDNATSVDEYTE